LSLARRTIFSTAIRKTPTTGPSLKTLREQASNCRACHLWKDATQAVFGEGPRRFVDDFRIAADLSRKSARAA
jgi:hypothetical protein